MDRVRVGVIGAGFMGALHARAVAESGFGTLVAVADPDVGRVQDLAVAHGAIAYTDYGDQGASDAVAGLPLALDSRPIACHARQW